MNSAAVSVVVPTLNESGNIEETLRAAGAAFPGAQLIVVDGGSTDETAALAAAAGAQVEHWAAGRGQQLARGAAVANGDVIVFLHADTRLPSDAAARLRNALRDPECVGGAFELRFAGERLPLTLRLLGRAITLRSRLLRTATGDQAIFARTEVLAATGGVPRVPLFEDVRLAQQLKRAGRLVIVPAQVATSPRLWLQVGPLRLIAVHLVFRLLHRLGVPPAQLARWYPASGGRGSSPYRTSRSATNRPSTGRA